MGAGLEIRVRPVAERVAFYRGQKAAYDMLLKMWPVERTDIKSFSFLAEGMMKMEMEDHPR